LMSQALRKLTGAVNRSHTAVIFTNQIREKVGVMFGSPETTTGGNALKFYASQRLDIRRIGTIKVGEQAVGNRTRVKVVKNKMAPPFRTCEFDIIYSKGISRSGDVIDLAVEANIIDKSGAWYSYKSDRIGQGRDNARTFLEEHPEMLADIEEQLLIKHGLRTAPEGTDAQGATDPVESEDLASKNGASNGKRGGRARSATASA
ncbi:MAG: DNA recombination/repair protein RecA, partial [Myxococcales bacterium]|nr:DNA recombination/repair protein RecA [Myxococcales bacterium]